jgi:predicted phosphoribosyltransferase
MVWRPARDAAATLALRPQHPAAIVVAVPVAAETTCAQFRNEVDDVVCVSTPEPFRAVGLWYVDFTQTTDGEVHDLLARASMPSRETPQKSREA